MRLNLIGPLQVITDDGREHTPNAPKIGRMLAVLALQPREAVPTAVLIQELWGQNPPRSAAKTLQTHVYHARRMFQEERVTADGRNLLVARTPGYEFRVNDDEVDVSSFEQYLRLARYESRSGQLERAAHQVNGALALWRGPVLSGVPVGTVLAGRIARVEELRINALELRIEIAGRLGRQRELLPDLRALVEEFPLHEWFHGQLISTLHQAGRRSEALRAYHTLYSILQKELGLEPSADLRRLQAEILGSSSHEEPSGPLRTEAPETTRRHLSPIPSLRPTAVACFG
ncbi:BTAD domain-containing putative transcriptional regulator [Streptomyces sp. NPDC013187]|uniref:AfsR/SARP family transcriptional regulator n=1 Tax=Streptomyces sp. NPDC013187 TaxID=3364865 RepID=UPI00368E725D